MQLSLLRLRHTFGLGRSTTDLRSRARDCRLSAVLLLIVAACFYIPAYAAVESIASYKLSAAATLLFSAPIDIIVTIPSALLGYAAIHQYALAKRGETTGIVTISGQCFCLIVDAPFRIFAQIGDNLATAHWYCLPIEWDYVLRADAVSLVLEAVPETGYATRLISVGFNQVDLPAHEDTRNGPFETFAIFPTPEIKAYLSRVRSHAWGVQPQSALRTGILSLLSAIAVVATVVLTLQSVLFIPYQNIDAKALALALLLFVAFMLLFSAPSTMRGIRHIRAARRGFRLADEPGLVVEGTVTAACPRRDGFTKDRYPSVYIELTVDDDTTLIFRIPSKLAHRVLIGNHVRVECNPATEVVTDVTVLDADEIAV